MEKEHKFKLKINNKEIVFRKWKVKDKKKFIEATNLIKKNKKNPEIREAAELQIKEALVYDCLLNKKIALSDEEYKYMLIKLRDISIVDNFVYTFECNGCAETFEFIPEVDKIIKPVFSGYNTICSADTEFKIGPLRNRAFYEHKMFIAKKEEKYIVDFILHVTHYNNDEGLSFDDILEIINDMDIDIFEDIFKQWDDMRFKIDNLAVVDCVHCGFKEEFEFDELPLFFPDSWNI